MNQVNNVSYSNYEAHFLSSRVELESFRKSLSSAQLKSLVRDEPDLASRLYHTFGDMVLGKTFYDLHKSNPTYASTAIFILADIAERLAEKRRSKAIKPSDSLSKRELTSRMIVESKSSFDGLAYEWFSKRVPGNWWDGEQEDKTILQSHCWDDGVKSLEEGFVPFQQV